MDTRQPVFFGAINHQPVRARSSVHHTNTHTYKHRRERMNQPVNGSPWCKHRPIPTTLTKVPTMRREKCPNSRQTFPTKSGPTFLISVVLQPFYFQTTKQKTTTTRRESLPFLAFLFPLCVLLLLLSSQLHSHNLKGSL